jgi:hypothetical protein
MKAKESPTKKRAERKARNPKPVLFTVDPPEGMRLCVGKTFNTDVVPKGTTLEFVGAHQGPRYNTTRKVGWVELQDTTTKRLFRAELKDVQEWKNNGTLKEL